MKNLIAKPLLLVILIVLPLIIRAQKALVQYFPAGPADASILVDGYLSKMGEAMASGLNSGWYTNGAPHSKLGIEFNVTFNTVFVPSEDEFFTTPAFTRASLDDVAHVDIDPVNQTGSLTSLGTSQIPAIYGSVFDFPIFSYKAGDVNENDAVTGLPVKFKGPNGNNLKDLFLINAIVVPTAQLSIGVIKNTDLKLRYAPEIKFGKTKFGSMGVGIMHSIKDHIPGLKMVPFGWSFLVAWSRLSGEVDLSEQWYSSASAESAAPFPGDYTNDTGQGEQVGEFASNAFTIQTIVSKKFSVLTLYAGAGYGFGNTEFDIKGDYYISKVNQSPKGIPPFTNDLVQPVSISESDFNTFEYDDKSFRFTTGLRLKFGPITFHGDYTVQRTSVLTFGLGFSVKESGL